MNSGCGENQKKIAAYALGDLAGEERQQLEAHLATCSRCRLELESYSRTIQQLASVTDEDAPRHFFVYPENQAFSPWKLFSLMQLRWQVAFAGALALVFLLCVAAVSRLQIRSDPGGWSISFAGSDIDPAAFRKEILEAVDRKNQESRAARLEEVQTEIARSNEDSSRQLRLQFTSALARMDSRVAGRIADSEGHMRGNTEKLVSAMYDIIAQQRARDLEAINLRFDSADVHNAIESRQTNEVLSTLLQVVDLKLQ